VGANGRRTPARSVRLLLSGRVHRSEAGFTLAELLVVIAILGIIAGTLGVAFVVSGKSAADTTQRLKESHDAQLASAYLAADVQSAQFITATTCAPSAPLTGQTNLINFSYDGAASVASWYFGTAGDEQRVVRTFCAPGGPLQSEAPIVHFAGKKPDLTCYTRTQGTPDSIVACDPNTTPTKIKIAFVDHGSESELAEYAFAVSGTRRLYSDPNSPSGITGYPPVLTLSGGVAIDTSAGHVGFHVGGGNVVVNSGVSGAATVNSDFTLDPGYQLQLLTGGTCIGCSGISTTTSPTPLQDPLFNLPAPQPGGPDVFVINGNFAPTGPLAPGIYILNGGMALSGQTEVTGSGVLLYFASGSLTMSGGSSLKITPYTGEPYQGMSIWLPRTNPTGALAFSGGASGTSVGGLVYAPTANISISGGGNSGNVVMGSIIAKSITGNGGGTGGQFCVNMPTCPS
jgi:prepilin-type N-terminal cleavage/methylation domain-containing protein